MDKDEINKNLTQIWQLLRETHTDLQVLSQQVNSHVEAEAEWKPKLLVLVETWHQAKGVVNFIKWAAAIAASLAAFWTVVSKYLK